MDTLARGSGTSIGIETFVLIRAWLSGWRYDTRPSSSRTTCGVMAFGKLWSSACLRWDCMLGHSTDNVIRDGTTGASVPLGTTCDWSKTLIRYVDEICDWLWTSSNLDLDNTCSAKIGHTVQRQTTRSCRINGPQTLVYRDRCQWKNKKVRNYSGHGDLWKHMKNSQS